MIRTGIHTGFESLESRRPMFHSLWTRGSESEFEPRGMTFLLSEPSEVQGGGLWGRPPGRILQASHVPQVQNLNLNLCMLGLGHLGATPKCPGAVAKTPQLPMPLCMFVGLLG